MIYVFFFPPVKSVCWYFPKESKSDSLGIKAQNNKQSLRSESCQNLMQEKGKYNLISNSILLYIAWRKGPTFYKMFRASL